MPPRRSAAVPHSATQPLCHSATSSLSVHRALAYPVKQIAANAGFDGSIVAAQVEEADKASFDFNALTHEYGDPVAMGVIVPTKVERIALQNAASIAGLLLTTEAAVVEIKEKKDKAPAGGGGMDDRDY